MRKIVKKRLNGCKWPWSFSYNEGLHSTKSSPLPECS
jgi:hypothetical protein